MTTAHVAITPTPKQARAIAELAIRHETQCAGLARALLAAYEVIDRQQTEIADLRNEVTRP